MVSAAWHPAVTRCRRGSTVVVSDTLSPGCGTFNVGTRSPSCGHGNNQGDSTMSFSDRFFGGICDFFDGIGAFIAGTDVATYRAAVGRQTSARDDRLFDGRPLGDLSGITPQDRYSPDPARRLYAQQIFDRPK